ncbi:hypothetical protein [Legionella sp. CNM-4043-24]|uniref:hypothetical protein n=1 Tax=Legionella sp. CNM-4043-24 TaxID=3421646 RepID=UPI00403AE043
MTTPFWQIKNKRFMTHRPMAAGDLQASLRDFNRGLNFTRLNGQSLLELMVQKLGVSRAEFETDELYIDHVQRNVTTAHLAEIIKEQLFPRFADQPGLQQAYCETLLKTLHQGGLMWAAAQSLKDKRQVGVAGYFAGTDNMQQQVNLFERDGEIYLDESVNLMGLAVPPGRNLVPVHNQDNSPVLSIKSRIQLRPAGNGRMEYKHTDLAMNYNNPVVQSIYDERGLLDKIRDFFKSLFKQNGMDEFSLDDDAENAPAPGPR